MEEIVKGMTSDKFITEINRNLVGFSSLSKLRKGLSISDINNAFTGINNISNAGVQSVTVGMSGKAFRETINNNCNNLYNNQTTLDARKLRYIMNGFGGLIHYGMCTYTGLEMGTGSEDPNTFAPTALSVDQWLDAAQSAGMKYTIFVSKHHDGFRHFISTHGRKGIVHGSWYLENGGFDIVQQYVTKCKERGLICGLYYSILDKGYNNHVSHTQEYINNTKEDLHDILTRYGDIDILWIDGWGWALNGYTYITWESIYDYVKSFCPNIIFFDNAHVHPATHSEIEGYEYNGDGDVPANNTPDRPSETVRSIIANGKWFWHPEDDHTSQTAQYILSMINQNNARYASYLLGIMPNQEGLIPPEQLSVLTELGNLLH